jgi:hypothetical protein
VSHSDVSPALLQTPVRNRLLEQHNRLAAFIPLAAALLQVRRHLGTGSRLANAPVALQPALPATGVEQMLAKYGRVACHDVERKVVGPAFEDVAAKYHAQTGVALTSPGK